MADSLRIRRVAEQIRIELSQVLREEARDPRIGLITITRVKLASDLGAATIFYSPLGEDPGPDRQRDLSHAMAAITGFARRRLSSRMKLRHTPELRFVLDDSIAEGSRTLDLIRELDVESETIAERVDPVQPGSQETNEEDGET
ncbi:MAG: ribosome-binding factor A [Deltaproteobacteria bacterium]|nr:ribosome-binding factor A [Deltaproteobacteria bacterium]